MADTKQESETTLFKFMVLVIIIAVLIAIAVPNFLGFRQEARAREAATNVGESTAVMATEFIIEELNAQIDLLETRVNGLEDNLNEVIVELMLAQLDADLDALEFGGDYRGSFTDAFLPTAYRAFEAGARRGSIEARFDRLIELTRQGLYMSSYHTDLVNRGGVEGLERYLDAKFERWEEQLAPVEG